ncbi:MAG TPA: zinc-binding alcohol dehydrogenase family protein [Chthoniobacteraceae bacterium]|jgi:2-desacetyl-2-hydroxyethyl bacteriochlorophyllide A dehydrogenase|nr:zinc-binding alcohol dehydrogenase family protein [Chthoniobacteraceae bacterium]
MKAIRLEEPGRLAFVSAPEPASPEPGEALVRVHCIGVCGTDIHAFGGSQPFFSYPRILGHELGVEVIAVGGGVANVKPGDRCAVEPYLNCGKCVACRRGKPNCCADLRVLGVHSDGGMRERFILPARKLHPSPMLPFEQLALVETLGIGAHAVERAQLESGEFALVIGAGPIGLSAMQFAVEKGARVIVLDINEARLEFCRRQIGVAHAVNGAKENALEALQRITSGELPTAVFDATGNPKSMMGAFDFTAPGGRLVFIGLFSGDVTFNDPAFHRRELTLMGSRNARPEDFTRIIRLIEAGRIDTTPWITHRSDFEGVTREFPAWTRIETGVIKAMIEL